MPQSVMGTCPYCSSPVMETGNQIVCPGCHVPHHEDCWQENGGCATFACTSEPSKDNVDNIDYTFDDLAKEYSGNKLVIEMEDLEDEDLDRDVFASQSIERYQNQGSSYSAKSIQSLIWAGLIAGFFVWLIGASYFDYDYYASFQEFTMVLEEIMAFSALMGGIAGLCLGSVEGITGKVPSKTFTGMIAGLTIGVFGAAFGAFIGMFVYGFLGGGQIEHASTLVLIRGIFWSMVGLFIGLGQGVSAGGGERAKNGLIGGLIGGFVGGVLFDFTFILLHAPDLSALVAITVFCICIGLSIGLVQEYRKAAWLKVDRGATLGKEYLIQGDKTTIGSAPGCDIVLVQDSAVKSNHAAIIKEGNKYKIYAKTGLTYIWLNNNRVKSALLNNGDKIKIGSYLMGFFEKAEHN